MRDAENLVYRNALGLLKGEINVALPERGAGCIEELLRRVQPGHGPREILAVVFVELIALAAELVGPRVHDGADQITQIEFVSGKVPGERIKQRRVTWRVGRTKVVDRIDDAATDKVEPDPVDLRLCERGLACEPVGESFEFVGV